MFKTSLSPLNILEPTFRVFLVPIQFWNETLLDRLNFALELTDCFLAQFFITESGLFTLFKVPLYTLQCISLNKGFAYCINYLKPKENIVLQGLFHCSSLLVLGCLSHTHYRFPCVFQNKSNNTIVSHYTRSQWKLKCILFSSSFI